MNDRLTIKPEASVVRAFRPFSHSLTWRSVTSNDNGCSLPGLRLPNLNCGCTPWPCNVTSSKAVRLLRRASRAETRLVSSARKATVTVTFSPGANSNGTECSENSQSTSSRNRSWCSLEFTIMYLWYNLYVKHTSDQQSRTHIAENPWIWAAEISAATSCTTPARSRSACRIPTVRPSCEPMDSWPWCSCNWCYRSAWSGTRTAIGSRRVGWTRDSASSFWRASWKCGRAPRTCRYARSDCAICAARSTSRSGNGCTAGLPGMCLRRGRSPGSANAATEL